MKISVYFPIYRLRITLLFWNKNPSIVFDQCASNVLGVKRRKSFSFDIEGDILNPLNYTESLFDWEPGDNDFDLLSSTFDILQPSSLLLSPSITTLPSSLMSHIPDFNNIHGKPRRFSISDIIDVLNLQEESFHTHITNPDTKGINDLKKGNSVCSEYSDEGSTSADYPAEGNDFETLNNSADEREIKECYLPSKFVFNNNSGENTERNGEYYSDKSWTNLPNIYCSSEETADSPIYIAVQPNSTKNQFGFNAEGHRNDEILLKEFRNDENKLLNLEKDKKFVLSPCPQKVKQHINKGEGCFQNQLSKKITITCPSSDDDDDKNDKNSQLACKSKKRGRKRVYDVLQENGEKHNIKKRERNNEACRKFRKTRKEKLDILFEQESELLQKNLNLKEQIKALDRQLIYIKEKLENEAKTNAEEKEIRLTKHASIKT